MQERGGAQAKIDMFSDAVENAVDAICRKAAVCEHDVDGLVGIYEGVLVHAMWMMSDLGVSPDELVEMAKAAVRDIEITATEEEMMTAKGGDA